jgi:hypothetical protein
MDPSLCFRKQTLEYGMETSYIASQKEVQISAILWKSDVDAFRADFGTLPRERHNCKQCPL